MSVSKRTTLGQVGDRYYYEETTYDITHILDRIGDRMAIVDACLPSQLASDLRRNGIYAVWVPAMLGDGASDEEIERQLLLGNYGMVSSFAKKEKVLLTRDVKFYQRIQKRAILVRYRPRKTPTFSLSG